MDKSWLQEPILGFELDTLSCKCYKKIKNGQTRGQYCERVFFSNLNIPKVYWSRAIFWYQKAAMQKEPLAVKEMKRIVEFRDAEQKAKNGDAEAQYMLALYYFYTYGTYEDYDEGSVWMRKAVINGSKRARKSFYKWCSDEESDSYDMDFLPPVIIPRGFKFLDLKKRHGKKKCRFASKYCIYVPQELYSGLDLEETERLANEGDPEKQYRLAWLYDQGHDVKQDMKEAIKWFVISAYNGYAPAQTELGIMYQHGIEATTTSLKYFERDTEP